MPNSPSEMMSAAMLPLRNDGMANSDRASSVDCPRRVRRMPHQTNSAVEIAATANDTGTGERSNGQVQSPIVSRRVPSLSHHPYVRPSMRPNTSPALAMTESTAPSTSMRRPSGASRDSETVTSTPIATIRPSGMLIPNAQRHEK